MKKIAIIVCGLILAFALTACGGSSSSGGVKPANNDGNQEQAADAGKQDSQSQGKPGKVEIAEAVILDEAGIKVTATGLEEDSFWGPELKLLIENNSVHRQRHRAVSDGKQRNVSRRSPRLLH